MATHTGKDGVVKVGANDVAEVRSFSLNETADTVEDTTMGDAARTHIVTLTSFDGSLDVYWDETDTNGQIALGVGSSVTLALFPEGDASGATRRAVRSDARPRVATLRPRSLQVPTSHPLCMSGPS